MFIKENTVLKIGFFKKAYLYETDNYGMVIENEGDVVCIYGTDINHKKIYCAIPLCHPKYLRKHPFTIDKNNQRIFISCDLFKAIIDFELRKCACTVAQTTIFGSEEWGNDVSMSWDELINL